MKSFIHSIVLVLAFGLLPTLASANMPANGVTMQQVEKQLGPPRAQSAPIGQPPIIRWVYEHFTVYFERDRVLHTVVHN